MLRYTCIVFRFVAITPAVTWLCSLRTSLGILSPYRSVSLFCRDGKTMYSARMCATRWLWTDHLCWRCRKYGKISIHSRKQIVVVIVTAPAVTNFTTGQRNEVKMWLACGKHTTRSCMLCTHHQILFGWSSQEEWDGQGLWHAWGRRQMPTRFWLRSLGERYNSEDTGVDLRMILKWIFQK